MAVSTTSGCRFYIGPVVNVDDVVAMDAAAALAFYEAIEAGEWTEVREVESLGDLGDTSEAATFSSVADRRVRKMKTVRDAGTQTVVCGRDVLDPGQMALEAAEQEDYDYAFKLIYADARSDQYTDSIDYYGGMVMSRQVNAGAGTDVTKRTFNIGINTPVIGAPSEALAS